MTPEKPQMKIKGFAVDVMKIGENPRDLYEVRISKNNRSVSIVCNSFGVRENLDNILKDLQEKYIALLKQVRRANKLKKARCPKCNAISNVDFYEKTALCRFCETTKNPQ